MKRPILLLLLLLIISFVAFSVDHHRWQIKTTPANLGKVRKLELNDLITLADPPGIKMNEKQFEKKLIPAFSNPKNLKEGDLVQVRGYMHLVALEDNDDEYHVQISGSKE